MLQPVSSDEYKVSVVSKSGVPDFGPNFPREGIIQVNKDFREKLFAKLINAEQASYKTGKLAELNLRYRQSLLSQMDEKVKKDISDGEQQDGGWRSWCPVL